MSHGNRAKGTIFLLIIFFYFSFPGDAQQAARRGFTILLSNDDGYDAPGLRALEAALGPLGEIYVSAPAADESAKAHSIATTGEPIRITEHKQPAAAGGTWYAVEAPPATCVRLAVETLLPHRPDVVISGINRGENLGIVVYYSGTLGAAREAAIVGLPAIAVSIRGNNDRDYARAAAFVRRLLEQLRAKHMLKPGLFLNVNVPAGEAKGVRVTHLSLKPNQESYERHSDPRGRYFLSGYRPLADDEQGTDVWAFVRGYITLTPMKLDVTSRPAMDALRSLTFALAAPAPK